MSSKVISVAPRMESTTFKKMLSLYSMSYVSIKNVRVAINVRRSVPDSLQGTDIPVQKHRPLHTCTCALRRVRLRLTCMTLKILLEPEWPINTVQTLLISDSYIKEPTVFISGRYDRAWLIDLFRHFFSKCRIYILIFHQVARCLTIPNLSKMEIYHWFKWEALFILVLGYSPIGWRMLLTISPMSNHL